MSDYLTWETDKKYDNIISNPPYSLGKEFVWKSIELLNDNGKLAMFLKVQFLEGDKEKICMINNSSKNTYMFLEKEWLHGTTASL